MRATALLLFAAVVCVAAAQLPVDRFRSGREVLTIETSVRDASGKPITDLQASDFIVRVDGQPRKVLTSRLYGHDVEMTATPGNGVAGPISNVTRPPGRAVMFAVDRDSIRPGGEKGLLDTAARLVDALAPQDAAAAASVPGSITDLTRDHAVVAKAVRGMIGTQPPPEGQYYITWSEVVGYEQRDRAIIEAVISRECPRTTPALSEVCPADLAVQARTMLLTGRLHSRVVIRHLTDLIDKFGAIDAPKHLVFISAGIPFDQQLLSEYRDMADKAARGHVALFVVQLDQSAFDASSNGRGAPAAVFGGRETADGLGTIASITGGQFFNSAGTATGIFDRIAADINFLYQLGVESLPSDADGKNHRVEVKVAREGVNVRAPAETATPPGTKRTPVDALKAALAQPTDLAELPLEVATYMTHSTDPEKVRVVVAVDQPDLSLAPPDAWQSVLLDANNKVIGAVGSDDEHAARAPWASTGTFEVEPGRYRLRTAVVSADRAGSLEVPVVVGLRSAGKGYASDLMIGAAVDGHLDPRPTVATSDRAVAMLELTSPESLADTAGSVSILAAGKPDPLLRTPLSFRTRADDKSIVVGEAALDLSSLPPGTYTATAILERNGAGIARVSRAVTVAAGSAAASAPASASTAPAPPSTLPPGVKATSPEAAALMSRVGSYVEEFGTQASVIVAVERYKQDAAEGAMVPSFRRIPQARSGTVMVPPTTTQAGRTDSQRLVSEMALVRNEASAGGWAAYRDVLEVNGKAVPDRHDRLWRILSVNTPDIEAARRISADNARYNVGGVTRTFNVPTAALFFFTPRSLDRFVYQTAGAERIDGVQATKIEFREVAARTYIMTRGGQDIFSKGYLWIDPSNGAVLRTEMTVEGYAGPQSRAVVEVTYHRDEHLEMFVPVMMKERYDMPGGAHIVAEATYADFKRFQTSATFKAK